MEDFFYVYILLSKKDGKKYTDYTKDLNQRLQYHDSGKVPSTKNRRPFELIYFEGCLNQEDALRREKYLKTKNGKMFLGNRLKSYLNAPPKV
jgi:putative endonuclease